MVLDIRWSLGLARGHGRLLLVVMVGSRSWSSSCSCGSCWSSGILIAHGHSHFHFHVHTSTLGILIFSKHGDPLPTEGGHRIDFDCILHQGGSCDSGYSIDSTYVMIGASQTAPPPLQNRKDKGNTNLQSTEIQNIPKATQTNTDPSGIVLICLAFASLINSVSCNVILFLYWGFCNGGEGFQSLCKQKSSLLLIADLRLHDTFSAELLFKRVAAY